MFIKAVCDGSVKYLNSTAECCDWPCRTKFSRKQCKKEAWMKMSGPAGISQVTSNSNLLAVWYLYSSFRSWAKAALKLQFSPIQTFRLRRGSEMI